MKLSKQIKDCINYYTDEYAQDQGLKAEDTMFYNSLPILDYFGKSSIRTITPATLTMYKKWRRSKFQKKNGKQMSNYTLGAELSLLRTALNVAVEQGFILLPADKKHIEDLEVKIPKGKPRGAEYIPTIEQSEHIISALPEHLLKLAFGAHRLGYRKSELCKMEFGWIDFSRRVLTLPASCSKNGQVRYTPLYPEIYDFLIEQRSDARVQFGRDNVNDVKVFRNEGKPINPRNVRYHWNKAIVQLRLPNVHFHDLRKANIKYLRIVKHIDREAIRTMYTGDSKEVFDRIYDCITSEDTEHWTNEIINLPN